MPDTEPAVEVAGGSRTSADDALRRALLALKDLRARAERAERAATEPIAIIGIGCRFPAGANSPEQYWELLRSGRDGVGTIPEGRWDHDAYYDPVPDTPGKIYTDQGGFIDQPVDQFDAAFFGIAPVEARDLDPQQRLLLEVTWEALEHAGVAPDRLAGSSTGVFVGFSTFDYSHLLMEYGGSEEISPYSGTGVAPAVAAGRLSYFLGLRGPSIALDTACSSSLVALSLAAQSLRTGGCRMAIAGGVNLMLDPQAMISLSMLHVLSPAGRCHTFGADADGYVRGEGCGMVVLKRLSDAEADGDRILAVVRAAAVNHDGKSSGLTVPSGPAQREVIERALAESGLNPTDIDFVEAHGTGTHLGDPIEVRALDAVYSRGRSPERPLLLASAKTNIGHLEAAAGIAGVIKTVLSLQHEEIPPHLNCDELSPHIEWASMPIEVTRQGHPWKRGDHVRRGAVSGFGWGGTNAHVIIEEAPEPAPRVDRPAAPFVVALSARDDVALGALAAATADALERADDARDVAWTLHEGRGRFRQRLAVTAGSADEAAARLRAWVAGESATGVAAATSATRTRVAFVFTGQGAQLPHMGRALYEHEPVFRAVLDECDAALRPHLPHSLLDVLYGSDDLAHLVHLTQYTQPAMFALQCGLTALWRSWGVTPDLVVGHSIGEYAAAVAAGVMDVATGAELIAARGTLMGALPAGGKMVAVFADDDTVSAMIAPHRDSVSIGSVNGATNVVISGDGDEIDKILLDLDDAGVKYRPLEVSHAFHSPLMAPMVAEFDQRTRAAVLHEPKVPFVSTVTGVAEKAAFATAAYWRDQVLATVRFAAAVESAVAAGVDQYLEIGPQPTLLGMIARIRGQETGLHPSLRPGRGDRSEREQILDAVGSLWAAGVEPNWRAIDGEGLVKVPAPTYPFQRQHYWIDTTPRRGRPTGGHPLLGPGVRVPSLRATVHEVDVSSGSPAWLDDHRLAGTLVMPGSAFAEMAIAAAGASGSVLELLTIREPLVLADDGAATVQTVVSEQPGGGRDVEVLSWPADGDVAACRTHAHATLRPAARRDAAPADLDVDALVGGFAEEVDVAGYYQQLADVGLTYGPTFRGLERLLRRDGAALGLVSLPAGVADRTRYQLHPALLDACFHVLGVAVTADLSGIADGMFVPVAIRGLEVHRSGVTSVWCVGTIIGEPDAASSTIEARLELYGPDGALVATIDTLEARKVSAAMWQRSLGAARRPLYELEWQPRPRAEAAEPVRSWVILGDEHGVADEIAAQLVERSTACRVVPAHTADDERARILTAVISESADPVGIVHLGALAAQQSPAGVQRMIDGALQLAHVLADAQGAERRVWFVTQGGQSVDGEAPSVEQSILWGVGRVLANELPQLGCTCIDIDVAAAPDAVDHLVAELLHADTEDQVALRGPRRLGARLVRSTVDDEPTLDAPYRLVLGERGSLDALSFAPSERVAPAAGEVAVEVRATGLNFRDVLNVLGMYPGNPGNPGLECAGVVTAVGDDVRDLAVGDHVFGIAPEAFDSHVVTPAHLMAPMPASITFAQAATLPVAYLTAIYGLTNLAGLRAGERVLVHAGAGGVGMAAIHLAQRIGAEVHATVGSAEKRQVMAAMGVEHVYSSRTLDFAEQIMTATGGEGIDVVLNSLADEFRDRSFEVLAPTGRFLEIGKRGIWTHEQASAVRPNGQYHPYQLAEFLVDDPDGVRAALHSIAADIAAGNAVPLPVRAFPAHQIEDAYRFMAQARHIGKVVITHRPSSTTIRDDGAYLVTGGLGGLGVAVATWLAEQGARHITLTGRSAPSADAAAAIAALTTSGVDVRVVRADVTDRDGVAQMIAEATRQVPLRGVFHAAGVLDDGAIGQQTWARFERVLAPKMVGAQLLDEATRTLDLDHFVLFSSAAALFGSPGQVNYAAANSALDALARRRRSHGLPALSINWGAWAEAGMAARLDDREQQRMAGRGVGMLDSATALDALGHLLEHTRPQVAVMAIDWPKLLSRIEGDFPALFAELATPATERRDVDLPAPGSFVDALAAVPAAERPAMTVAHVTDQVVRVLGLSPGEILDGELELANLGMDSLMAVELTNRLRSSTGLALDSSIALEYPTIHALSAYLVAQLDRVVTVKAKLAAMTPEEVAAALAARRAQG